MPAVAPPPLRFPMLPIRNLRIVSHPFTCAICEETVEAIASTAWEAEKRAIDLYSAHLKTFHASEGRDS